MNELAEELLEISGYLHGQVEQILKEYTEVSEDHTIRFRTEGLLGQPVFLQGRVMLALAASAADSRKDFTREHVKALLALAAGETGKKISLPHGVTAEKSYGFLCFSARGQKRGCPDARTEIPIEKFPYQAELFCGHMQFRILKYSKKDAEIPKKLYTKWFDYDRIKNRLYLRTRKPGDYFVLDGQGHRQKLKDYWMNEKVPKQKREQIVLLADGSHILWAVGGRISEYYKVTEQTKRILEVQYREYREEQ